MQVSLKKAITLVELLISVTLMGIIVLGAIAFHLAGERFLVSSETKARVLNDLSFVLQHLQKNILLATGSADNPGINVDAAGINLSLEQIVDNDPNVTRTVDYQFDTVGNTIRFRVDAAEWKNLTSSFIDLGPPNAFAIAVDDGGVKITNLALRLDPDPASAMNDSTNPQITTIDTNDPPNRTIYFYSLAHTW